MTIKQLIWSIMKKVFPILFVIICVIITYIYASHVIEYKLDYYSTIINGIISGVVTAFIIFIVQILWRRNILVWIENLLYQDVCIEGEWSGFLVPYIGLDDLDKLSKQIAWRRFREMHKMQTQKKEEKTESVEASVYNEKTGVEEKISAEIVLTNDNDEVQKPNEESGEKAKKRIEIDFQLVPIIVKVDIKRVGHQITGKIIEIGGASQVCSYSVTGSFKNLILSGCYQTTSKDNIDRGALSLMLFENGKKLEGFFSSYNDEVHKVAPMQCVLRKRNQLSESNDTE